jgi:hypothetical protein
MNENDEISGCIFKAIVARSSAATHAFDELRKLDQTDTGRKELVLENLANSFMRLEKEDKKKQRLLLNRSPKNLRHWLGNYVLPNLFADGLCEAKPKSEFEDFETFMADIELLKRAWRNAAKIEIEMFGQEILAKFKGT